VGEDHTLEKGHRFACAAAALICVDASFAWSLLLAAGVVVGSLVPLGAARSQANFQLSDLAAPRAMADRLPEWGKRANWAHLNSFEAFSLFAPAALLCLITQVHNPVATAAAWLYPGLRLAYIAAYVANLPPLRSLCWASAMVCTGLLYLEGLKAALAAAA
jgi:uncharacterized MAPEG superfamily protein